MKKFSLILIIMSLLIVTIGCTSKEAKDPLNPDKPITVTIWHYYNGNTKEAFDTLVSEFNETVGIERGIVVDAKSQGDVTQLATAVFDAANESIGSAPMPDIFASYADNAFRVHQIIDLVSLDQYFTVDELEEYRSEFLEEGQFITDQKYYIMPIAKSSENLYINKNYWELFATEYGYTESDLSTWESINEVAKVYYEATGKGFFSLDANANYLLVANRQHGQEFYVYNEDGTVSVNFNVEIAKKIWDNFYVPYINGYFVKTGRFSSDDAKTGSVISYTGSTAGAAYFPSTVSFNEQEVVEIEPLVLPYPYFESGEKIAIQQGAGMCITKSDEAHEYASALFLKWFTDSAQNLKFAVSTGYFPVKNSVLEASQMIEQIDAGNVTSPAIVESIKATEIMFNNYTLYNSKPFLGSYEMRTLLDTHLITKIQNDLEYLNTQIEAGEDRDKILSNLTSGDSFEEWYQDLLNESTLILNGN